MKLVFIFQVKEVRLFEDLVNLDLVILAWPQLPGDALVCVSGQKIVLFLLWVPTLQKLTKRVAVLEFTHNSWVHELSDLVFLAS